MISPKDSNICSTINKTKISLLDGFEPGISVKRNIVSVYSDPVLRDVFQGTPGKRIVILVSVHQMETPCVQKNSVLNLVFQNQVWKHNLLFILSSYIIIYMTGCMGKLAFCDMAVFYK